MSELDTDNYGQLLGEIKQRIRSAQYEALKVVNQKLIALYWDIGQSIVTRQQEETWGKSVVEQLSQDLQREFPGISGFSARNIWNMRSFYLTYCQNEKLQPLVAEIGWTHNSAILILKREEDEVLYLKQRTKMKISSLLKDHERQLA